MFEAQKRLGNPDAGDDLYEKVHELLMRRKPALSGNDLLKMLGKCTFESEEYRAPKAAYSSEYFVWLTRLNNLRLNDDGRERELSEEERREIIHLPFTLAKLNYKQVRKKLGLSDRVNFIGLPYVKDDEDPESKTFFQARAFHKLAKAYKDAGLKSLWERDRNNPEKIDTIAYALSCYKTDDDIGACLKKHGIEKEVIEAVLGVSFSEFIRLSLKAVRKIIPYMEEEHRYDEAVIFAGYQHHSAINQDINRQKYLPPLLTPQKADSQQANEDVIVRNPVVFRACNQARKLINAIVKKHGSPKEVHIELARDLSRPFKERKKIESENEKNRKRRESSYEKFKEIFKQEPRGADLQKLLLYDEQDCKCLYSQSPIELERLIEPGYLEIDHILPYSRTFDDSQSNKVLVLKSENQEKSNKTPHEYFGGDEERWTQFEGVVRDNPKIRTPKVNRLLNKSLTEDEAEAFRERNLNDTRYICKFMKNYIEKYLRLRGDENRVDNKKSKVVTVNGRVTAYLRIRWGLKKSRDEDGDLHHAMDAAVVAACSHKIIQDIATYARQSEDQYHAIQRNEVGRNGPYFPRPWKCFRDELLARLSDCPSGQLQKIPDYAGEDPECIKPIRVSRAPTRRGSGQAHEETIRSDLGDAETAVKTSLEKLTLTNLDNMVGADDPRNRALYEGLRDLLQNKEGKTKKELEELLKSFRKPAGKKGQLGPLVRAVKIKKTQPSGIRIRGGIADNGDMLRVDVFVKNNRYYGVPLYVSDVVKPSLPNKAARAARNEGEWPEMDDSYQFCFSLYPNDWVCIDRKNKEKIEGYYAGFHRASAAFSVNPHDRKGGMITGIGVLRGVKLFQKYHVDMLGSLYLAPRETRQALRTST